MTDLKTAGAPVGARINRAGSVAPALPRGTTMTAEQHRALIELDETTAELDAAERAVARLVKVRDRRVMRAVAVGVDRVIVADHAGLSRQRVGQIATGVEKGAGKAQVAAIAKTKTPRGTAGVEARLAALGGDT